MEQTGRSETLEFKLQTLMNRPEESIQCVLNAILIFVEQHAAEHSLIIRYKQ
jgi:hypothetical protein